MTPDASGAKRVTPGATPGSSPPPPPAADGEDAATEAAAAPMGENMSPLLDIVCGKNTTTKICAVLFESSVGVQE